MSSSNKLTLQSYEAYSRSFLNNARKAPSLAEQAWLECALSGLPDGAHILEVGSGDGRDAAYVESLGYDVECSEATPTFVSHLLEKGFLASKLDVLTDPLMGSYDLVLANNVLVHFTKEEMTCVLEKVHTALKNRGRFAFSLEKGEGERTIKDPFLIPRYHRQWQEEEIVSLLSDMGYSKWQVNEAIVEELTPTNWLHVIAYK